MMLGFRRSVGSISNLIYSKVLTQSTPSYARNVYSRFCANSSKNGHTTAEGAAETVTKATEPVQDPRLLGPRQYAKKSPEWWREWAYVFFIFGVTGSTMAWFTRYFIREIIGIDGSIWNGPKEFRAAYFSSGFPIYTMTLVLMGNIFGRGVYFNHFAKKMVKRSTPLYLGIAGALTAYCFVPSSTAPAVEAAPAAEAVAVQEVSKSE